MTGRRRKGRSKTSTPSASSTTKVCRFFRTSVRSPRFTSRIFCFFFECYYSLILCVTSCTSVHNLCILMLLLFAVCLGHVVLDGLQPFCDLGQHCLLLHCDVHTVLGARRLLPVPGHRHQRHVDGQLLVHHHSVRRAAQAPAVRGDATDEEARGGVTPECVVQCEWRQRLGWIGEGDLQGATAQHARRQPAHPTGVLNELSTLIT